MAETRESKQSKRCPICGAPQVAAYRPFCSRRCADLDLGRWMTGQYVVPGEPADLDEEG
ncbi:MAG: DNA gyrase inhibitor YacG [Pseudomonadota bacterium]